MPVRREADQLKGPRIFGGRYGVDFQEDLDPLRWLVDMRKSELQGNWRAIFSLSKKFSWNEVLKKLFLVLAGKKCYRFCRDKRSGK